MDRMRVAICGDGIGGRIAYRLLSMSGLLADLYGKEKHTKCRIRPCGFGTSASCINLVKKLGIEPEVYVLRHDDYINMTARNIRGDLYWIDKPMLLTTLANHIRYDKPDIDSYDIVVDATGIDRVYSPLVSEPLDKKVTCCQYRVTLTNSVAPIFDVIRGGYIWVIPLGEKEAHIGGGSSLLQYNEVDQLVLNRIEEMQHGETICCCSESIRLSGPIFPVVNGQFVTIGESAGLVVPFGGAGIHAAFESAMILVDQIHKGDLRGYDDAIRRRFGWLSEVRKIVDDAEKGKLGLLRLGTAYRALLYQGLKPTLMDLLYIRKKLIDVNK